MPALLLVGFWLLLVAVVTWRVLRDDGPDRIRRDFHRSDRQVESEFGNARRAMNKAAGQSWRNLAD